MSVEKREIDGARTSELNLPELLVLAHTGNQDHFYCVPARELVCCSKCGSLRIRNQGKMHRDYIDVIRRNRSAAVIVVTVEFQKNKCLSPGCGRVFYPSFSFASPYSRTTHRLENAVVRMVLKGGYSYSWISDKLDGKLSKQVVYQVFHRRIKELETDLGEKSQWYRELLEEDPEVYWRYISLKPNSRR